MARAGQLRAAKLPGAASLSALSATAATMGTRMSASVKAIGVDAMACEEKR